MVILFCHTKCGITLTLISFPFMKCMTISYGTINSFGGNNLSYVTAHLLIAEARPGPRSVQFSSFTPRCRQAPGGGGNCGRNALHEHPRMSRVTVLNMTRTSMSRAPHLRSTSRWGEAGLVLTLKIHKQRRGGLLWRACEEEYHALSWCRFKSFDYSFLRW
jgi:hypothetical protein